MLHCFQNSGSHASISVADLDWKHLWGIMAVMLPNYLRTFSMLVSYWCAAPCPGFAHCHIPSTPHLRSSLSLLPFSLIHLFSSFLLLWRSHFIPSTFPAFHLTRFMDVPNWLLSLTRFGLGNNLGPDRLGTHTHASLINTALMTSQVTLTWHQLLFKLMLLGLNTHPSDNGS